MNIPPVDKPLDFFSLIPILILLGLIIAGLIQFLGN